MIDVLRERNSVADLERLQMGRSSGRIYEEQTRRMLIRSNSLLHRLLAVLQEPRGVEVGVWNGLSNEFSTLNSLGRMLRLSDGGEVLQPLDEFTGTIREHLEAYESAGGYRAIATARALSIREINEWMARGIMPLGSPRRPMAGYDGVGFKEDPGAMMPDRFRAHDDGHFKSVRYYEEQSQAFDRFRRVLASSGLSPTVQQVAEVAWFYAFHEQPSASDTLKGQLVDSLRSTNSLEKRIAGPFDLGVDFGRLPTSDEMREGISFLRSFTASLPD